MTAAGILEGVAIGLDALAAAGNPKQRAVAGGAALVVRSVASMLTDRTPAECIEILEAIRDHGTRAIGSQELDAQKAAAIGRAAGV